MSLFCAIGAALGERDPGSHDVDLVTGVTALIAVVIVI
jgi:hypothetical protein